MNSKKALILLNMGGIAQKSDIKVFLSLMFNDKNILPIQSVTLRRFIAFLIVSVRAKKVEKNLQTLGASPLPKLTKQLIEALEQYGIVSFELNRYLPPYSKDVVHKMKSQGVKEVVLLPMYVHYSTTTTKSSFEDFKKYEKDFQTTKIHRWYKNSLYNDAILERVYETISKTKAQDFELIFSAHGIPKSITTLGDPYEKECKEHVQILNEHLEKNGYFFQKNTLAYQSRVVGGQWSKPYLEDVLKNKKNKNLLILPISFVIDNSETTIELGKEYAQKAQEFGIKIYKVVPCVNEKLASIIKIMQNDTIK